MQIPMPIYDTTTLTMTTADLTPDTITISIPWQPLNESLTVDWPSTRTVSGVKIREDATITTSDLIQELKEELNYYKRTLARENPPLPTLEQVLAYLNTDEK